MRWLEGLGGQNREEGQGVYGALGVQLLSKESRNSLNSQLNVYPAGQSQRVIYSLFPCGVESGGLFFKGFV